MRKFFLTASPLKLFLVLVVFPFGLYMVTAVALLLPVTLGADSSDSGQLVVERLIIMFQAGSCIFIVVCAVYGYGLGVSLNKKVPEEIRKSSLLFRIVMACGIVYTVVLGFLIVSSISAQGDAKAIGPGAVTVQLVGVIFLAYTIRFLATNYSFATEGKETDSSDRVLPLICFLFYFVGIWILQPKIRELFADEFDGEDAVTAEAS